ncbi:MAG TPA: carboxypeptidase-like regulatory domain-containing protein [Blastocatellia bacterium]|nr:carboxypeptidase-like regulatory domain-containing protein [Blastocatellia bacterium]
MSQKSRFVSLLLSYALILLQLTPVSALGSGAEARRRVKTEPDTITGTLQGRVVDPGKQPLVNVRVRVINQETGNDRAAKTGADGWYQINLLPLGLYSIEATKEGFTLVENAKQPIKVKLNETVKTLPDIILAPGSPTPPATIAASPPAPTPTPAPSPTAPADENSRMANQADPTRRGNSDERMVNLLPLSGVRSFDDLALLAAGVAPPPQVKGVAGPGIGAGIGTAGQFSVNGQRARSNNFTVDGSDNNDEDVGVRRQGFVALVPQSVESIKEIQIVTHLWDAEHGRSAGSQVNAVSKSGTNFFHGQLYDFFNHSALNARNFFDYSAKNAPPNRLTASVIDRFVDGQPVNTRLLPVQIDGREVVTPNPSQGKDQFQRNQGGAALGFPIVRNKTFFFGSFERQDIKARQETHFAVPTVTQRGFLNRGATGFVTVDSANIRQFFLPTFLAGDSVWSLYPFANNPVGPYGENTFTQVLPADARGTLYSLKLDHNFRLFGPEITHTFTARYNFTDDERQIPAVGDAIFSGVAPSVRTQNLSLFLNSQLSPTMANQLRASYGRTRLTFDELRDNFLKKSRRLPNEPFLLNAPGIANLSSPQFPLPFVKYGTRSETLDTESNLEQIGQVLVHPFSPVGLDVYLFPQARANNTAQVADTYSYFRSNHAFKFGFDIRRTQLNSFLNRNFRPQVVFGGSPDLTSLFPNAPIPFISQFGPTPGFFSGSDLASLGLPTGIFQSLAIGAPDSTVGLRFWQLNFFANDNWRPRRGLTLDYGLRYELNTTPREVNSRIEDTFSLSGIPAGDPSLNIAASFDALNPTKNIIFDGQSLRNSFNATLGALRGALGGRDKIFESDRNNFGGHVGFALDPFAANANQAGKTVIRGGVGAYYDLALGSVVSQSRNVFPTFLPINIDANTFAYARDQFFSPGINGITALFNPRFIPFSVINQGNVLSRSGLIRPDSLNSIGVPNSVLTQVLGLLFNPAAGGVLSSGQRLAPSGGGLAFTLPDNSLRSPYSLQYNLQFERELYGDLLLNLAYVGSRGVKLTRFRTPNGGPNSITLPIDPLGLTVNPVFAFAIPPLANLGAESFSRPNPLLGAFTIFDSSAASTYNSFQATATKRFSQGYQFGAAYTWSHAIDDVSDVFDVAGSFVLAQDDRALDLERGNANFDIRHRIALSSTGNLPLLHRYNDDKGAAGFLMGGWQYSTLMTFQTGQPFTVNTSYDVNMDGNLTDRIDTLSGLALVDNRRQKLRLTTNSTGLLADLGANGRVGRNVFRASGVARTDFALVKNFNVSDGQSVLFRVEAFNLFNRSHFAIPVRVLEAPSFGSSVDTSLNPRQIQFALKYVF